MQQTNRVKHKHLLVMIFSSESSRSSTTWPPPCPPTTSLESFNSREKASVVLPRTAASSNNARIRIWWQLRCGRRREWTQIAQNKCVCCVMGPRFQGCSIFWKEGWRLCAFKSSFQVQKIKTTLCLSTQLHLFSSLYQTHYQTAYIAIGKSTYYHIFRTIRRIFFS